MPELQLEAIRRERRALLESKGNRHILEMIENLPEPEGARLVQGDAVTVAGEVVPEVRETYLEAARALKPWRKGPFEIFGTHIDTEWRSDKKYNLLRPHFDLGGKRVADIGCNNGYYLFRMLEDDPALLVGFDPSKHYCFQFMFLEKMIRSGIRYEMLGVEHLPLYGETFDVIFCLGVLYHRSDPVAMLKTLYDALEPGGELLLDTMMIDGEEETALCPSGRYALMANVYFIPTVPALLGWLARARFQEVEVLARVATTTEEQRKTEWMDFYSLEEYLDKDDPSRTVEGYPAPKRVYIKARKAHG